MAIGYRVVSGFIFLFSIITCSMAATALKEQGAYPSPGRMCTAVLTVSTQGGFLQLSVQSIDGKLTHVADDVTGFLWINEKSLVFSSGPIYGRPGIYEATCVHKQPSLRMLIGPMNINLSYPHGADYFELKEINDRNLKFFYETDVDSIDFNEFRTEKYLRSIELVP
ncbi:MAG: hypothetical protein JSR51_07465 [Proteobacteria bacterium]|nr:hypothetical protein [Pseudomonadota bacterium]